MFSQQPMFKTQCLKPLCVNLRARSSCPVEARGGWVTLEEDTGFFIFERGRGGEGEQYY